MAWLIKMEELFDTMPEKLLHTTFFSSMSGKDDVPGNYANVIYEAESENGRTILTISQDNIADEKQLDHMGENRGLVAGGIKKSM